AMRAADLTPLARDVMRLPASGGVIFFSIVAAYALSALEWTGGWLLARPDFVLLVLLFWTMHEPRSIGQGIAFAVGLVEQTLHVLGLFVVASLVTLLLNLLLGADFPGLAYFISPVLTALFWGPTSALLYSAALRRRRGEASQ